MKIPLLALVLATLAACSSHQVTPPPAIPEQPASLGLPTDFSGHWELNYQLSDRVMENANLLRLIAAAQARRQSGRIERPVLLLPALELIELADDISQSTVLEIEQDSAHIEIKREDEFPLTCFFDGQWETLSDPFGSEVCGWDRHQLVFAFRLPDSLNVMQRLTLGPDGERLNVATTVRGRRASQSFTLNRVYTRFEPLDDEFECRYTLTRGKSCRRARSGDGEGATP